MLTQVVKAALKDKEDKTQFYILYANQTPVDVLLRTELDAWATQHPDRVHIWYTVDKVPEGTDWPFSGILSILYVCMYIYI